MLSNSTTQHIAHGRPKCLSVYILNFQVEIDAPCTVHSALSLIYFGPDLVVHCCNCQFFILGIDIVIDLFCPFDFSFSSFHLNSSVVTNIKLCCLLKWLDSYFVFQKIYAHLSENDVSLYTYTSFTAQWCSIAIIASSHLQLAIQCTWLNLKENVLNLVSVRRFDCFYSNSIYLNGIPITSYAH